MEQPSFFEKIPVPRTDIFVAQMLDVGWNIAIKIFLSILHLAPSALVEKQRGLRFQTRTEPSR
jgi:hypothetical protein